MSVEEIHEDWLNSRDASRSGDADEGVKSPPFPCAGDLNDFGLEIARVAGIPGDRPCFNQVERAAQGASYSNSLCVACGHCMIEDTVANLYAPHQSDTSILH